MNKKIADKKIFSSEYQKWILSLKERFLKSQIKASIAVNSYLIKFYLDLGKDISNIKSKNKYGSNFYEKVSRDLQKELQNIKGLSSNNIRYANKFYEFYSKAENFPQLVENFIKIPWGHHRYILDKCKDNLNKAIFYINKTIENNWSRNVLLNFLDTKLYERQGKAVSNFSRRLSLPQSDLAQEITKDPYNFDFLSITEGYKEKELKDSLMANIIKFLLELGTGFCLVGREYKILVGKTEQFLDMLFFNINLNCYIVIEIKTGEFEPQHIGQLGTYVSAVNHMLKKDNQNPTIGLLICKTKDNILAQYSLETSVVPIGISEYELSKLYPKKFRGTLPTIKEIEEKLK